MATLKTNDILFDFYIKYAIGRHFYPKQRKCYTHQEQFGFSVSPMDTESQRDCDLSPCALQSAFYAAPV